MIRTLFLLKYLALAALFKESARAASQVHRSEPWITSVG
ncbi:hypothetical protein PSAC2689_10135 [Paraburkholderia sacchari]